MTETPTTTDPEALVFDPHSGLIPAIVQDADTGRVLMLGYMNPEALANTRQTGLVTFYSRSRKRLWTKGETSGNTLALVSIAADCDRDALLIQARPAGPTCHLGTATCWGDDVQPPVGFLAALERVIASRKSADPAQSYTARLLAEGVLRCAQKVGEEGVEVALSAAAGSRDQLVDESADLLYHLLVLLAQAGVPLETVCSTLTERHGGASARRPSGPELSSR